MTQAKPIPPWLRPKAPLVPIGPESPVDPGSPLDHALRYAAVGWQVFPVWGAQDGKCRCGQACVSPGKHPISHLARRGQDDATTDPAQIRLWWTQDPDAGIAVHLAPSGLCAIDIDPRNGGFESIDAVEGEHGKLQSDVYQFTQAGGEHRIFKCPRDAKLPGKLGPGIDVKHHGYIVLAPTQGVSGKYDWEASSDPLEGAIPSPLPDWMRDLRGADHGGIRIEQPSTRFATAGQLGELQDALSVLPADDRDTWIRFGMALYPLGQAGWNLWTDWSKRSAKFDPVDQIRVWRSFRPSAVNFETIFYAAQQSGWTNPLAGSLPPAAAAADVALPPAPAERPEVRFELPGLLGQVQEWIGATARKPQPMFAVQAALAFGATVMGRRFVTTQRNWPSLYFLNIGKSASGKEHAKWALEQLLEACGLDRLVGPDSYTSDSGVLSSLHRQPSHLAVIDEFGKVLEAASIKHGARAASTMRALMEVWGRADGTLRPQGYSTFGMSQQDIDKMAQKSVRNPALTLLAMTTPDTFFDTLGSAAARDGFLNRFLIVESSIGRQAGRQVGSFTVPQAVVDWAHDIHRPQGIVKPDLAPSLAATPAIVGFAPEASAAFSSFEAECVALMDAEDDSGLPEMFGRTAETAMRLSLIIAVACGERAISMASAELAIRYVRHHAVHIVNRLREAVADSEFEALKLQVLASIRQAGRLGLTEREISKRSRRFRAIPQRQQIEVLNSLVFTADIQRVEFQSTTSRGGALRKAWVLTADAADNPPTPLSAG